MNLIGANVKRFREIQQLTQDQLATRCKIEGWNLSRGTLAKIEARVRRVTDYEVATMAKALRISVSELFSEPN
ncbi:transcriptional regulator [Hahella sp. CCB-MM4]|uniref:helix-turn-helix domain-containing protein n=1 Tax=Hahella sp. (strain CCB-MM4) TaxID=1926491 RepID=UPI000B9B4D74|nr:helix-turn-helix transcriptional regulator [Hahella sp. CCB-MM4]OZG72977.1 transcriptional regulator [Hahella sp. CCB-MM4]